MDDDVLDDGGHTYNPDGEHAFPSHRVNEILRFVEDDSEITAYLEAQNVNPVARKGYNDHGATHVNIVKNRALSLFNLLKAGGIGFNGAREQGLEEADEPVIIALAAILHDVGHVVHRDRHPYYSVPIAADILDRILPEFYDTAERVRVKSEILHAIICHHTPEQPLTREAGVVRVADALDMERGRSRMPYERGGRGIDTLSSQAITNVALRTGEEQPVLVEITMSDAAGVYQVDELLKAKLDDSRIEEFIRIVAVNTREDDLLERIEL
ncbi:HD domain-containing protein [Halocatena halophila]|uniref:HD domain-containing protein n=1 Tax=Halocatena halophila TaxID=2814576 RepID=UPI002ED66FFD